MAIGDKLPVVMGAEKAIAGGVATLGSDGILSESQRPAYTAEQVKAADLTLSNLTNPQQALANLGAGVRPNLADNCDFTNPVNTAGFTSGTYSSDFNILDRWTVQSPGGSITATLTEAGLQINTTASNQGIRQAIDAKNFSAQLYTSSVIIDGVLYSAQFPKPTGSVVIIQYPGSNYSLAITPYGDAWFWYPFVEYQAEPMEVTISHCKLEEGEGQTLAYEDESGALVILPQPDSSYAVQLLRCQMYGTSSIVGGIGASPRLNLLDNAYFVGGGSQQAAGRLPINQRGKTNYVGIGYTLDAWNLTNAGSTVAVTESGVDFFAETAYEPISQSVPKKTGNGGMIYTLSVLCSVISGSFRIQMLYDDTTAQNQVVSGDGLVLTTLTAQAPDAFSKQLIRIQATAASSKIKLIAAKLEEGDGQTLAYQDESGAWQLLPQPDMKYGAQLAECQRYLTVLKGYSWIGSGVMDTSTQGQFFIPLPTTMRILPTLSGVMRIYNGPVNVLATAFSANGYDANGINGFFNVDTGTPLQRGDPVHLWLNTNDQLTISAEL